MPFTLGRRAVSAGYRVQAFDEVGSTNVESMAHARDGERGPVWFVTTEQTAGRGRRQRPWIAPRGNPASTGLEATDVASASVGGAAGQSGKQCSRGDRRGAGGGGNAGVCGRACARRGAATSEP